MSRLTAKLNTFGRAVRRIENWPTALALRTLPQQHDTKAFRFRNGLKVLCRPGTEDWNVLTEVLLTDGYQRAFDYLRALPGAPHVLDLGANIGLFSLRAALEHPHVRVTAYEPAPPTIAVLKQNLLANPQLSARINVAECGAGSSTRTARFFYDESSAQSAGIYYERPGAFDVPLRSFADIVAAIPGQIALLKMDIEGAEFEIVRDTPAIVWNGVRAIAIELHPPLENTFGPDALLVKLQQAGFSVQKERIGTASYFLYREQTPMQSAPC